MATDGLRGLGPEQLVAVARTTAAMAGATALDGALRALLGGLAALTGAERGGVRLLNDPARPYGRGPLYYWRGGNDYAWLEVDTLPGSDTARALESGSGVYSPDLPGAAAAGEPYAAIALAAAGVGSSLIAPLRAGGRAIGTLHADAGRPHAFAAAQLVPLQVLADQAGAAVAQARLAEEVRATQERLTASLWASGTVLFGYDAAGRMDMLDGDAETLTGWPAAELLGRHTLDMFAPAVQAMMRGRLAARFGGHRATERFETLLRHRSGREVPVVVVAGPRLERGRVVGGAGAVIDMSHLRRLEVERDAARSRAGRAESAVVGGRALVEALGQPLEIVLGIAGHLAADPRLPPDARQDLQVAQEAATRAGEVLHRFARLVGRRPPAPPASAATPPSDEPQRP